MQCWAQVHTVHPCVVTCMEWCGGWKLVDGSGTQSIYYDVMYCTCSWRCNGLELCSRLISCFHAFWWFPWPILAHCKCFSSRIPFLFQYRSINLRIMTCISGTSRDSTEVQEEKTRLKSDIFSNISGLIMNIVLFDMLNLWISIRSKWQPF